ncbi:phosphate acetyltransferase [uncultured Bilophila sp.]|uniref:phosphate acetyltransferase n=1 Tax=uncultured Bilophila sp. TaxID=529385 RepID=UPI0026DC7FA8|nr:phosphate acetyltransferase [uncultured Bilophila sp.]
MAHSLYITGTEDSSGKSVVTLGLMRFLQSQVRKIAFFRPIIDQVDKARPDPGIDLVLRHFELDMSYEDAYACTYAEALDLVTSGNTSLLIEKIFQKYKAVQESHDFVLCQGTDFRNKDTAFLFDLNTEIAASLNIPLALVINGQGKGAEAVQASVRTSLELLKDKQREVACVFVNRVELTADERAACVANCADAEGEAATPVFLIGENPALCNPSVGEVRKGLNAEILFGKERLDNLVHDYLVAAMQVGNFMNYLQRDMLIVTPGDRSDIILASLASQLSSSYPHVSGILLTGGIELPDSMRRLMEGWTGAPVPILSVGTATYETLQELAKLHGKIAPEDHRKIGAAMDAFAEAVDKDALVNRIFDFRTDRVTPMMFEFNLAQQAQRHRMRIVLPEGEELRILRAAEALCERGIADIILLGDAAAIQEKIRNLNLKLDGVTIIQPTASALFETYADRYYELRKAKGATPELARERMNDATYFGTMMVHMGDADGMVSGSVNTTAHTIRPAFEIIKTKPGTSIVSSVFFMCLKDRILVFGDCAVNPNPSAEQLADIAVSSAHTARVFGVEPYVAMLSYSTGTSGKGESVDKVAEAARLAQAQAPELPLDGPIQYDAAIDPDVARTKAPGSPVAGHASVFIFPDLNTGNNTYKAVQRAADALAIGPVLQGLNKPVNDLSRGCTVPDIVNTVMITAIQAQAEKGLVTLK